MEMASRRFVACDQPAMQGMDPELADDPLRRRLSTPSQYHVSNPRPHKSVIHPLLLQDSISIAQIELSFPPSSAKVRELQLQACTDGCRSCRLSFLSCLYNTERSCTHLFLITGVLAGEVQIKGLLHLELSSLPIVAPTRQTL
jgi:hypothetical protein